MPSMSDTSDERIKEHMALLETVRKKAALKSQKADEQAIARQSLKEAPSKYKVGDEVLVQFESKKCNKVKGKGVAVIPSFSGKVVDCNLELNKYKVMSEVDGKEVSEWISVSRMSSTTRAEEITRDKNVQG